MTSYSKLKKLDEESLQKIQESAGPSDRCICSLLAPPDEKKSIAKSLKKAFGISTRKNKPGHKFDAGMDFGKGSKGFVSTKEVVKRQSACGTCGCDDNEMVLRHSYANIRITSPDVSSICPCPTNCLPDKEKLKNNIKVIVEHGQVSPYPTLSTQSMPPHDSR